jgi:hypothetical protein
MSRDVHVDVAVVGDGLIDLNERPDPLDDRREWMPKLGFDCEWLDAGERAGREPHLSPTATTANLRAARPGRCGGLLRAATVAERLDIRESD